MLVKNTSKNPIFFEAGLILEAGEERIFSAEEQARHKNGLTLLQSVGQCKMAPARTITQFIAENEGIQSSEGLENPANASHRAASENSEMPVENIEEIDEEAEKAKILAEIAAELQSDKDRASARQHSGKAKKPAKKRKRSRKVASKDKG